MESLWRSYRSRGVRFIGIDTNDAVSDARKFMHRHRITYAVVHDGSSLAASDAYGVGDLPVSYVIDRQGRLVGKPVLGRLDETQQAKMFHAALTEAIER